MYRVNRSRPPLARETAVFEAGNNSLTGISIVIKNREECMTNLGLDYSRRGGSMRSGAELISGPAAAVPWDL